MRLRPHRRDLVIWSPSACRAERGRGLWFTRPARPRRIRSRLRTLALLAAIGLVRLSAAARASEIWRTKLESFEAPPLDDAIRAELDDFVTRRRRELGD